MNENPNKPPPTPRPIAARLPAEPGWSVLYIECNAKGVPIPIEGQPGSLRVMAAPIVAWGFLVIDPAPTILDPMAGMGAMFGAFMGMASPEQGAATLVPIGEEGQRLDALPGLFGYRYPGEPTDDAMARIRRPMIEAKARRVAEGAKRGERQMLVATTRDGRWSLNAESPLMFSTLIAKCSQMGVNVGPANEAAILALKIGEGLDLLADVHVVRLR